MLGYFLLLYIISGYVIIGYFRLGYVQVFKAILGDFKIILNYSTLGYF